MPISTAPATPGPGTESARTCGELVTSMLQRVGVNQTDPTNRSVAMDCLRQAADEMNLERSWVDRRLSSAIALTAGQQTYPLPTRFRKTVGRIWLLNSSGVRRLPIEELAWEDFLKRVTDEATGNGLPILATIQNRIDPGTLKLWQIPSTDTVTAYPSIELDYYADIPGCLNDGDTPAVSGALQQAIYLQALSIANDILGDKSISPIFVMRAERALSKAISYDSQMRIYSSNLRGRGGVR